MNRLNDKSVPSSPPAGSKVFFAAAVACAERIKMKEKRIQISGAHRGVMATLDNGWIIIEKQWYSRS